MEIFWRYFRDTLGWPLVRVPGALAAIVAGAASLLDQVREDMLWLRRQFNPATCEEQYLDHYAQARGIRHHRLESADRFRARVVNAYTWQLQGGRVAGLFAILSHYGYAVVRIVNLRDEDPARWAEFRVVTDPPAEGFGADDYELLAWVINEQKPARSKLAGIRLTRSASLALFSGMALISRPRIIVAPYVARITTADSILYHATGIQQYSRLTIQ
jgi:hypothetical protein